MSQVMNPTDVHSSLRETYLRYLETSFYLKDSQLREQFSALLLKAPPVREPILEVAPGFESSRSVAELIDAGVLAEAFKKLDSEILHRPLFSHQETALQKAIIDRRNLVIATGTGSGKTECFLFPILHELLLEVQNGTIARKGVRALLLYPMNALANDQIARLREWASLFPEITFGRYTGETKQDAQKAEKSFHSFHGKEPQPNELISRYQMRKEAPPHILFTNYAMLEYLLIRPKDSPLFEGDQWRFIVLDEVHSYSGAMGIEIAMLLRRLKDRVANSEKGRLQCIGTSATLGAGEKHFPKIASFAENLFGEAFSTEDIIPAKYRNIENAPQPWGTGTPQLYDALRQVVLASDHFDLLSLVETCQDHDIPSLTIEAARKNAQKHKNEKTQAQAFLYHLLLGDSQAQQLREQLHKDRALELSNPNLQNIDGLVDLVALGTFARKADDPMPLISARYHIMARAMGGMFAWIDDQNGCQLLAKRNRRHKGHAVFEMGSCNRCGELMLVGEKQTEKGEEFLKQPPGVGDDPIVKLSWFVFDRNEDILIDEDGVTEEGKEKSIRNFRATNLTPKVICKKCGRIGDETTFGSCEEHDSEIVKIYEIENKERRSSPRQCPSCLNHYGSVAQRVLTGKGAPVAVLATSLYQEVPSSQVPAESQYPGGGRKLMMFSDSRQDAAFFAPFMDNTYNKLKQRRYLVQALKDSIEPLDLEGWALNTKKNAEKFGEWDESVPFTKRKRAAESWVLREWITTDRRIGLEGTGTAFFRLRKPSSFQKLTFLSDASLNLSVDEQWSLIQILLDTLRHQGIVSFGEYSPEHGDEIFKPRNVAGFIRNAQSNPQKHIYAWEPAENHTNKRLDYLMRLCQQQANEGPDARSNALVVLREIWKCIIQSNGPLAGLFEKGLSHKGESNLLRLRPEWWDVRTAIHKESQIFRCNTCGTVTAFHVRQICPMTKCQGKVVPYLTDEKVKNHFFSIYTQMAPIPLEVREHTAQLEKEEAAATQQDFINGKVNMLSCTTTFELGVDVGDLQTVFLRNIPPSPGNYVQRAGRAGRRAENAAIIVSYAQRRTHDFAYFENWDRMVKGFIRPPTVKTDNVKIARRHVHAEALAAFYRKNRDLFADRLEALFDPESPNSDELIKFLESHPKELQTRLMRIVPEQIWNEIGIKNWAWLSGEGLKGELRRECFIQRLDRAKMDIQGDWDALEKAKMDALEREDGAFVSYKKQLNTLKGRSLLGKLGTYGLMPKYGFPTEVVELKIRSSMKEAMKIELDRDLKLALSEFAPGNQVVANKKVWTSRGIVLPTGERKLHQFSYWYCKKCHFFSAEQIVSTNRTSDDESKAKTCHCKETIPAKHYLYPEFGFTTESKKGDEVGDARPPYKSYSSVFYHEDEDGGGFEPLESMKQIECRESRHGWIHVINNNRNKDFWVCMACGYAFNEFPDIGKKPDVAHQRPWQGHGLDKCQNTPERISLGYRYRTDVLELKIPHTILSGIELKDHKDIDALWLSTLYALVNGACEHLEINERDLGGCLYYSKGPDPLIVLFDTAPGGAGFVKEVKQNFKGVINAAKKKVKHSCCAEDSSCVSCLRTYFNQRDHNLLQRGLALKFLNKITDYPLH